MKINVIGDIHGRTNWKDLVLEDAVNVFVGDYFDPYDRISADDLMINFTEICEFKRNHPETVLLYGNHDFHYIVPFYGGSTTRYDGWNAKKYHELFEDSKDLFNGIAYAPDSTHIITHAGITKPWLDRYLDTDDFTGIYLEDGAKIPTTREMERFINGLWYDSKESDAYPEKSEFSFGRNCDRWDTYGTTPTQSPIWIRPESLDEYNVYKGTGVIQIVGHTQLYDLADLSEEHGLVFVDCLGQVSKSYTFNTVD